MHCAVRLGVDVSKAKEEFEVIGETFNFDKDLLKRKTWKVSGYGTGAQNLDGLIRKDFGAGNGADEAAA